MVVAPRQESQANLLSNKSKQSIQLNLPFSQAMGESIDHVHSMKQTLARLF